MTVGELILALAKYPQNARVAVRAGEYVSEVGRVEEYVGWSEIGLLDGDLCAGGTYVTVRAA